MRDLRALGWCSRKAREVARRSDLNWSKFLSEGIELEELKGRIDEQYYKDLEAWVQAAENQDR